MPSRPVVAARARGCWFAAQALLEGLPGLGARAFLSAVLPAAWFAGSGNALALKPAPRR